jgi:hypothetical protein
LTSTGHTNQAEPGGGHQRLVLGVDAVGAVHDRVRQVRRRWLLAPRLAGAAQVGRHPPTALASQASRLSIAPALARLSRIQASWTASSASLVEPGIR